jgi:2-polyprenyl-6-methoxyphenol hydroxylase-like FAD-dependent oxidoreductase
LLRAIIVGGGIGGLTTAIALRRAGAEVVVLEKAGELREIGAGISIWVNAVEALEGMGLADAVLAVGREGIEAEIRTADGATLSRVPLGKRFGRNVILTRSDLQRTLLAALEGADVPVRVGAECVGFRQEGSCVVALLDGGREERGDLLVGADGLNSVIRRQTFGDERPRYAGFTAWRGLADLEQDEEAFEAWGRGSVFGFAGLGRGRFYWYATKNAPEGQADSPAGRKAELLKRFRGWHEPVPAVTRRNWQNACAAAQKSSVLCGSTRAGAGNEPPGSRVDPGSLAGSRNWRTRCYAPRETPPSGPCRPGLRYTSWKPFSLTGGRVSPVPRRW